MIKLRMLNGWLLCEDEGTTMWAVRADTINTVDWNEDEKTTFFITHSAAASVAWNEDEEPMPIETILTMIEPWIHPK